MASPSRDVLAYQRHEEVLARLEWLEHLLGLVGSHMGIEMPEAPDNLIRADPPPRATRRPDLSLDDLTDRSHP